MKTTQIKDKNINRKWYLVDAKDQILGRFATRVASLLIGKGKVDYTNHLDCGDYVVIINSKDVKLTRGKESTKMYYSHSGYPGGFKELTYKEVLEKDPTKPLRLAIKRMLPQNRLTDKRIARLFIYEDDKHLHEAQKPEQIKF